MLLYRELVETNLHLHTVEYYAVVTKNEKTTFSLLRESAEYTVSYYSLCKKTIFEFVYICIISGRISKELIKVLVYVLRGTGQSGKWRGMEFLFC